MVYADVRSWSPWIRAYASMGRTQSAPICQLGLAFAKRTKWTERRLSLRSAGGQSSALLLSPSRQAHTEWYKEPAAIKRQFSTPPRSSRHHRRARPKDGQRRPFDRGDYLLSKRLTIECDAKHRFIAFLCQLHRRSGATFHFLTPRSPPTRPTNSDGGCRQFWRRMPRRPVPIQPP